MPESLSENAVESGRIEFGVPPSGGLGVRPPEGGTPNQDFQTGSESEQAFIRNTVPTRRNLGATQEPADPAGRKGFRASLPERCQGRADRTIAKALVCLLFLTRISAFAQEERTLSHPSATITNLAQFWELSHATGGQEFPTRMQLVINYYDPEWKVIWLGLDKGGSYLSGGNKPLPFKSGQIIELDGVARPGKQEILWDRTKIKVVSSTITNQPIALPRRIENFEDLNLRIIQAEGLVSEQVEIDSTHLRLELTSDEWHITAYLHLNPDEAIPQFSGAFVQFRGVFSAKHDSLEKVTRFETWVAEASHIQVISWLSDDPRFGRPATAIEEFATTNPSALVRVEGIVHGQERGKSLTLRDATGQVKLLTRQTEALKVGDRIEGIGFPDRVGPELILRRSFFRPLAQTGSVSPTQPNLGLPKLRLTEQVRKLNPEEAARGYPVRIDGVVTWSDPETNSFFVMDASGGVKVTCRTTVRCRVPPLVLEPL